jgi:hypothetical protein
VRLRVSDAAAATALLRHLADEGFPSTRVGRYELDVLFPGRPGQLVPAAELDLWGARHEGVSVTVDDRPAR